MLVGGVGLRWRRRDGMVGVNVWDRVEVRLVGFGVGERDTLG